jgi:hypothetical protein
MSEEVKEVKKRLEMVVEKDRFSRRGRAYRKVMYSYLVRTINSESQKYPSLKEAHQKANQLFAGKKITNYEVY